MQVKRKSDGTEGIIKQLTPTQVLLMVGAVEKSASAESFLANEWEQSIPKEEHTKIEQWADASQAGNIEALTLASKGQLLREMFLKCKGHGSLALELYSKMKNVIVTKEMVETD